MSDRERIAALGAALLEAGITVHYLDQHRPPAWVDCDFRECTAIRVLLAEPSASAQPEPLDVERLAEAIRRTTTFRFADDETSNRAAVVIAASYAALAEPDR